MMFLFLYVENVACWASGALGFFTGHSTPSIIIRVFGYFALKSEGAK
jgi:hypothetical protein